MVRGFPSLTALLAMLAIAGYQNRDKLSELFNGASGSASPTGADTAATANTIGGSTAQKGGSSLENILSGMKNGGLGGLISSGLGELLDKFNDNNKQETAKTWVSKGPNEPISSQSLEQALGPDIVNELTTKTGLSRQELLDRLSRDLPRAVDDYTPDGQIPAR